MRPLVRFSTSLASVSMASPWWEFWATEMLLRMVICAEAVDTMPMAKLRPNISLLNFIRSSSWINGR
jgi:hypothetical protein